MTYEVMFGEEWQEYKIVETNNPYHACIVALRECLDELEDPSAVPIGSFRVCCLQTNKRWRVKMSFIIRILILAAQYDPDEVPT